MSPKKPSIEELFYRDELKLIVQLTLDAKDAVLETSDIPFVIGALTFLARLDDATALYERFNGTFTAEQSIISRFFLGIAHCRHYKFVEAQRYLIANVKDRRKTTSQIARYYIYHGLAMYRYTYGRLQKAVVWSTKALQIAVGAQYFFGRVLAAELHAHAVINSGQLRLGLRLIEELQELARELGYEKIVQWNEINRVLYQANFGLLGANAVQDLQRLLQSITVTDSFSRASILLEISRQHLLAGRADLAKQILDNACQDIYQVDNLRLETLLNLRIAHYLYMRGEKHQALNLIRNSLKRMSTCEDKVLEQRARGFEAKILEDLGLTSEAETILQHLHKLNRKSGLHVGSKILQRKNSYFELENVRGQDPLGDVIDLIHLRSEDAVQEIVVNGWYGLFYKVFLIAPTEKVIYFDIERSGSITFFDRGNVQHFSRQIPPLIRKLLLCLRYGEKTKEQLVEEIWRYSYQPQKHDSLVYALIANARKLLEGRGSWIEASDSGYRFVSGLMLRQRFDVAKAPDPEMRREREPFAVEKVVAASVPLARFHVDAERFEQLNFRQRQALQKIEREAVLDSQTYRTWFEVSEATANRDLAELVDLAILSKIGKARATKYVLKNAH